MGMTQRQVFGPMSLEVPGQWRKETVVYFVADDGPRAPTMVLSRNDLRGETLMSYVFRALAELPSRLPAYELIGSVHFDLCGRPAIKACMAWESPTGPLQQIVLYVAVSESELLTITASSHVADGVKWEAAIDRVLQTLRFDDETTPARASSPAPPTPAASRDDPRRALFPMPGNRTDRR